MNPVPAQPEPEFLIFDPVKPEGELHEEPEFWPDPEQKEKHFSTILQVSITNLEDLNEGTRGGGSII